MTPCPYLIDVARFKDRFLFWDEISDDGGRLTRNTPRQKRYNAGLIVRLRDIMLDFESLEAPLAEGDYGNYSHPVRARLRRMRDVVDNYRLSFIELAGIEVGEVCQIFERINQEGQPLDIFDIVVAKTFRLEKKGEPGFYLREMIEGFREEVAGSHFAELDDMTYLQVIGAIIYQFIEGSGIYNVTPTYLERIRTEQIEAVWDDTRAALRKMFDFLENRLHLKGPRLVPYRYFYLTIATHFFRNERPNYDFLKQYFWYYSFHNDDLLTSTTNMRQQIQLLHQARSGAELPRFLIDRDRLRTVSYSTRGRLVTAILALLANHEPRDWQDVDRHVLNDVYYELTDRPNLHHVFPRGFMEGQALSAGPSVDSMMNIAYLTQITNIKVGARNPLEYLAALDQPDFAAVLAGHLIPTELLEWAREEAMPDDAYGRFVEKRIDLFVEELRARLPGIPFDAVDTRSETEPTSPTSRLL